MHACPRGGGTEKEGERIPSRLFTVSRELLETVRSWPQQKSRVRRLTDWSTQMPLQYTNFKSDCESKILFYLMFFLFLERTSGGGAERRGQRILSGLCTDSSEPNVRLELMNHEIMKWAEAGCSTNRATQVPWMQINLSMNLRKSLFICNVFLSPMGIWGP